MYSTIKKNAVFEGIVSFVRDARDTIRPAAADEIVMLDFADRSLLDTNRLPFRKKEIRVSIEEGQQQQLVAVVKTSDTEALVVSQKGLLFTLSPRACDSTDCMVPAGRLMREDGSALNDIYDVLMVPTAQGQAFYVSFGQERPSDNTKAFYLARVSLQADRAPEARYSVDDVVFESTSFTLDNGHAHVSAGGGLAYDPDGNRILMTIGDFGLNGYANRFVGDLPPAQDPQSDLGKVHAIDLATGESTVVSTGHRNPQGLVRTQAGDLISTEHGPKGGDEVNIIRTGKNYGWPYVTLGTLYERYVFPQAPLDDGTPHGGYEAPMTAFVPSIGISALTEAQDLHPAWDGDLLIGSLKAQSLFRLRPLGAGHYIEEIHIGDRIRDIEIVDGVLLMSSDAGKLLMLEPFEDVQSVGTGIGLIANKNALSQCAQCHSIGSPRSNEFAPHLVNVYSRQVASLTDYDGYSDALKARHDEVWNEESLRAFLSDPQGYAPGSGMPSVALSDAELDEIIELLPLVR
ncbi:PQQ-dependent sugar dehydrogenase [Cognatishimia sp. MH4019]|uniref:PQQ-dependent sugar dehydrogenase n=1 Tax=Cognatishimia sp. MH4019 TaxID=2854030 RepID=UPI001CD7EFE2|nr:PQQ-dependent sugar dehydrogenase [Cognatishimia sp. MH4019]